MTIDKNVAECDKNIEERFELSETESNRHQNEKLQTQDVFEVRIKQQQHGWIVLKNEKRTLIGHEIEKNINNQYTIDCVAAQPRKAICFIYLNYFFIFILLFWLTTKAQWQTEPRLTSASIESVEKHRWVTWNPPKRHINTY